ncbi:MAG: DUF4880 domain-containing protein [Nitrospira sp.]|nr:DUF4880 domain-containing protein [Nitrospira sp.]
MIDRHAETPDTQPPRDPEHDHAEQAIAWSARVRSGRMTAKEQAQFDSWRKERFAHEQ